MLFDITVSPVASYPDSFLIRFGAKLTESELVITERLMYLASINVAITFPFTIFSAICTAYERFIFSKAMQALRSVMNPLLIVSMA